MPIENAGSWLNIGAGSSTAFNSTQGLCFSEHYGVNIFESTRTRSVSKQRNFYSADARFRVGSGTASNDDTSVSFTLQISWLLNWAWHPRSNSFRYGSGTIGGGKSTFDFWFSRWNGIFKRCGHFSFGRDNQFFVNGATIQQSRMDFTWQLASSWFGIGGMDILSCDGELAWSEAVKPKSDVYGIKSTFSTLYCSKFDDDVWDAIAVWGDGLAGALIGVYVKLNADVLNLRRVRRLKRATTRWRICLPRFSRQSMKSSCFLPITESSEKGGQNHSALHRYTRGQDFSVDEIRKWHTSPPRNWSDIGYHFLIRNDENGTIERGRPIGRAGAHVKSENATSIGIVYVGGVDKDLKAKDTMTACQEESLLNLWNPYAWFLEKKSLCLDTTILRTKNAQVSK